VLVQKKKSQSLHTKKKKTTPVKKNQKHKEREGTKERVSQRPSGRERTYVLSLNQGKKKGTPTQPNTQKKGAEGGGKVMELNKDWKRKNPHTLESAKKGRGTADVKRKKTSKKGEGKTQTRRHKDSTLRREKIGSSPEELKGKKRQENYL